MEVHLVDGTYELFRHFHALPSGSDEGGQEIAAVRGVLHSMLALIREGATHIGVATDHVIESFRNQLWPGYKTAEGIDPELLAQFPLLEEALTALGIVVWPMIEYEADDAFASAVNAAVEDPRVDRIIGDARPPSKAVRRERQPARSAHQWNSLQEACDALTRLRQCLQVQIDIVRDEQIQLSIAVVGDEGTACSPVLAAARDA